MSEHAQFIKFGWIRDLPSISDYTVEHPKVKPLLAKVKGAGAVSASAPLALATAIDLRGFCSPIENQGVIGSCTAHAGVGMVEYYQRRAFGKHVDGSRLFLYKVTRNLLGWSGDTGAYLRSTMEALAMLGVPPEQYWPYDVSKYDVEPSAFLYALADNFEATSYYRLDPSGTTKAALLNAIKTNLAAGLPSMFGFTVYSSYTQASAANQGAIPYPASGEKVVGGHAVMAVGYDDAKVIKNTASTASTTGALLIRNSWGTGWGNGGYGWLPYAYVQNGLATDWWTLISQDWVNTGNFG
ncbi:MAG TPA: C1 family peptidase [Burkholderiaceae bacterium]|nr:C1 family peptidase [Burkholderiaceae bacterium]HMY98562.1 C1 family peptidase [Burkholderiaceae bacterium]HNB43546.1 C1 family peptidase [Burkholderiaceae bacterium]HNG78528.1 C1 family peptidase [Burkholderiaceae bacterium]